MKNLGYEGRKVIQFSTAECEGRKKTKVIYREMVISSYLTKPIETYKLQKYYFSL